MGGYLGIGLSSSLVVIKNGSLLTILKCQLPEKAISLLRCEIKCINECCLKRPLKLAAFIAAISWHSMGSNLFAINHNFII